MVNLRIEGKQVFRPEFVNRRLRIIPFAPISDEVATIILNIQLKKFAKLLDKQGIKFKMNQIAREYLVKTGFNAMFGARPLRDAIKEQIGNSVADLIIGGKISAEQTLTVGFKDDNLTFDIT